MLPDNVVSRLGGAAFILGNLMFLANKFDEMSRLFFGRPMADLISGEKVLTILVGQSLSIIGFLVYLRVYGPHTQRSAKTGLLLFCGGGILLAIAHVAFTPLRHRPELPLDLFVFVLIGLAAMLFGLTLFGIANLRSPILGRWRWLPLATAVIGISGFFLFSGEPITIVFLTLRTLFAIGLVGLGVVLSLENSSHITIKTI